MNNWGDFVITLIVRFISGAVLGALASFLFGFRTFMGAIANDGFPVERVLIWAGIGGVLCMFTAPRESWPWT